MFEIDEVITIDGCFASGHLMTWGRRDMQYKCNYCDLVIDSKIQNVSSSESNNKICVMSDD